MRRWTRIDHRRPTEGTLRPLGSGRAIANAHAPRVGETPPAESLSFGQMLSQNLPRTAEIRRHDGFPVGRFVPAGHRDRHRRRHRPAVWSLPLAKPLGLYVEVLRGTPLMLQLFAIFFLLPKIGLRRCRLSWPAIAGLAINYSAYEAEIYRAGLQAIPRGQMEAALALGMSRSLAIRRIILPQAFRIVIPPVTNDFIALFKDTSVCSVITIVELTKQLFDPGPEHRRHCATGRSSPPSCTC